jgi:hypothetical protein
LEDHVERNSFCSNMPVASTLNKESKVDSAMWVCLILWSYQKDGSITASFYDKRNVPIKTFSLFCVIIMCNLYIYR